jgi:hypothetical protein
MDQFEKHLKKQYAIAQSLLQLKIYQQRATRMTTPLQRYFNSTATRNAFAKMMFFSAHVKSGYNKTQISKELFITRQASHTMVEECLASGWIEVCEKGRSPSYKSTQPLIEANNLYTDYHLEELRKLPVRDYVDALENYQAAKSKATLYCSTEDLEIDLPSDTEITNEQKEGTNVYGFHGRRRESL